MKHIIKGQADEKAREWEIEIDRDGHVAFRCNDVLVAYVDGNGHLHLCGIKRCDADLPVDSNGCIKVY